MHYSENYPEYDVRNYFETIISKDYEFNRLD